MKSNDEASITALLRHQISLEHDIMAGDLTVLIRTRDERVIPIQTLESDPEADASIVVGG